MDTRNFEFTDAVGATGTNDPIGMTDAEPTDATAELVVDLPTNEGTSQAPTAQPVVKPRRSTSKGNKGKTVNRAAEECYNIDPKKMTDKEKIDVINYFQSQIAAYQESYKNLDNATRGAFAQARQLSEENAQLKREAAAKIGMLKQNINMMYQNSLLITMEV